MAAATKTDYQPTITEAQPVTEKQKRLAAEGYRAFWVEASGNSYKNGLHITRYLVTLMPDGYLKCPCEAGKTGKGCRHKSAVHSHVGSPRTTNIIAAKPVPQATFACTRPSRLASSLDRRDTAMPADRGFDMNSLDFLRQPAPFPTRAHPDSEDYIPADYYQHAYR